MTFAAFRDLGGFLLAVGFCGLISTAGGEEKKASVQSEVPRVAGFRDTWPDALPALDGVGRRLPMAPEVPAPRADRFVAMFYFLWHDESEKRGPFDISRILAENPGAIRQPTSPPWGPEHAMHHWGESIFGYYLANDPWVIRKHAQMLSDAGVDVIIFDTSNKLTYRRDYVALMSVYRQMRSEGARTPQVAFLTPFWDSRSTIHELYEQLYSKHEFEELWFQWEGKPLILGNPKTVAPEEQSFFTFRVAQPDYFKGPTAPNMWSWLEVFPQHVFLNSRGEREQMSVGVAQNAVGGRLGSMSEPDARGRSFHGGKVDDRPGAVRYGYNFAEQWERALQEDPKLIFVTGWNEWVAGRFSEFNGIKEPPMFVDEFDEEHSRDIEPMKGGHGDDYYYQLISYIRRYKGARAVPAASGPKTIRPDGDFSDWNEVAPEYLDDLFDTEHRDHAGFANAGPYRETSGRNDFDTLKVARDSEQVCLYAQTREAITAPETSDWMILLVDTDANPATGWGGYDLLINRTRSGAGAGVVTCSIERNVGNTWQWESAGEARIRSEGKQLQIVVPRALFRSAKEASGVAGEGKVEFDFKWTDGVALDGDLMKFHTQGDAAPNGRFAYRFRE